MDCRPIGVFDSGLGGLTAMDVLDKLLPGEDIIYFGDSGRMPYGGRQVSELMQMAKQDIGFLVGMGAKLILAACGTLSTVALPTLAPKSEIPVFGVIESAARRAVSLSKTGHIGVIATQATIAGGEYMRVMNAMSRDLKITAVACPLFVPLVEAGKTSADDSDVMAAAEEYLSPIRKAGADVLLLGCTHYPLLNDAIRAFLGGDVELVSAGETAALELVSNLEALNLESGRAEGGRREFYTSGNPEEFSKIAAKLLPGVEIPSIKGMSPFDIT